MILQEARPLARRLVRSIQPFCYAVEIAGSIRREKTDVKDVEPSERTGPEAIRVMRGGPVEQIQYA